MINIFKVNGRVKVIPLIIALAIPLIGSGIVWYLTKNSVYLYSTLDIGVLAPPAWLFMVVWPILYFLMGISSYRIYMLREQGKDTGSALFFYAVQLLLNFLWSFIFFSFRLYAIAFIEIIILFIFVIITFIKFIKIDKIAGFLLVPYILWLTYASFLAFMVWLKNEM